jgi:hypothetical protein
VLDEIGNVEDGSDELYNAINACGEQTVAITNANDLKDSQWGVRPMVSSLKCTWKILGAK